jgi:hypothetical protein
MVELAQERLIGPGQGEIPDQLRASDLREAAQPRQLLRREHIPGGHTHHLVQSGTLRIDATLNPHPVLSCANGWKRRFFAGYYGLAKQPKLSARQQRELERMAATGEYTIADLAEVFTVSRATMYRTLQRVARPPAAG